MIPRGGRSLGFVAVHWESGLSFNTRNGPGVWPWGAALSAPVAATALALALDGYFSIAGLSMVFLIAVAGPALFLRRTPAAACAVLCVVSLNYFFVPPRGSLAVDGAEYWLILATLLGLALVLSAIVESLRTRRAQAELSSLRARRARELGAALAEDIDVAAMVRTAAQRLAQATGGPSAIFLRLGTGTDTGHLQLSAASAEAQFQHGAAQWVIDNGRPAGRGCNDWPDLPLWCAPLGKRSDGAAQVLLPRTARPGDDELAHWRDLVAQAGSAIERERSGAAAKLARDEAQSEAARNTLLASLSHDLRTPLAALVGSASALRAHGGQMSQQQRDKLLTNIEDEALDLTLMAENVLQTARLAQPSVELRRQWESLEDILGAAVSRVRRRWPDVQIALRCPPGLPLVFAEAHLLAQAVANLVDNAARHGGAEARVVVQAGRAREGVFVAVRDFGAGLPPGDPAHLFARWRGGGASSGGTGLGLSICELAARAHGGTIEARREAPGAEFRIDLPAAQQPGPER